MRLTASIELRPRLAWGHKHLSGPLQKASTDHGYAVSLQSLFDFDNRFMRELLRLYNMYIYICSGWLSVFSSLELGDSSPESPSFNVVKLIKCEYRNMLDEDSLYNGRNKLVRLCHVDKHTGHPKDPELAGTARVLSGCRHPCQ